MKILIQTIVFLSLAFLSLRTYAPPIVTPEIGTDNAALGIGLLTGLISLISERRRK